MNSASRNAILASFAITWTAGLSANQTPTGSTSAPITPPTGQIEILGLDLTLKPAAFLDRYKNRDASACNSETKPNDKEVCINVDAVGPLAFPKTSSFKKQIEVHFYKGRAWKLSYEPPYEAVIIDSVISEAKKKYRQEPGIGWVYVSDIGPISSKWCILDFKVNDGVLSLMTLPPFSQGSGERACLIYKGNADVKVERDKISLEKVEWQSIKVIDQMNKDFATEKKQATMNGQRKINEQTKTGTGL